MNTALVLSVISTAVIVALVQARTAHKANQKADKANETAIESNRLAEQANQISTDANTLSERAIMLAQDKSTYSFDIRFDKKIRSVIISNKNPTAVNDFTVTILYKSTPIVEGFVEHLPRFGEFVLKAEPVFEEYRKKRITHERWARNSGIVAFGYKGISLEFVLRWRSESGMLHTDSINKTLR